MSAGSTIREVRLAAGLTQAQLGRRLGITQPSVARLEGAGDSITVATVRRALDVMNHTAEITARPMPSSVDETLIVSSLGMSPGERLERFEREYARAREFALEVQPQLARVA